MLDDLGVARAKEALGVADNAAEAVIGGQGITAVGDEAHHPVEIGAGEVAIGPRPPHLLIEGVGMERGGAGAAHDVLGEDVQRPLMRRIGVEVVLRHRRPRRLTLQHLETVGGNQNGAAGLVHPVIGPADALDQAGGALWRSELDDEVHRPPVDAKIKGRGADDGAQLSPGHRRLHLAPLLRREAAVVQGDGEVVVIEVPQSLEGDLRLEAGVDEDEGDAGPLDDVIDLGHGVAGGEAGPGHPILRDQHVHHRRGAPRAADDANGAATRLRRT